MINRIGPRVLHVFLPGWHTYGRAIWLEWKPTNRLVGVRAFTDAGGRRYTLGAWIIAIDIVPITRRDYEAAAAWHDRITR